MKTKNIRKKQNNNVPKLFIYINNNKHKFRFTNYLYKNFTIINLHILILIISYQMKLIIIRSEYFICFSFIYYDMKNYFCKVL